MNRFLFRKYLQNARAKEEKWEEEYEDNFKYDYSKKRLELSRKLFDVLLCDYLKTIGKKGKPTILKVKIKARKGKIVIERIK